MKVSVITPVYNKRDYVEECLRSVLSQEMDDFEVIAVDDGSTDGSGEICDKLAKEYSNLRVLHVANGGVTRARRIAYEASEAEYITFVDSDDRMLPGGLRALYEAIVREDADEVVATYRDTNGRYCDTGLRGVADTDWMISQLCSAKAKFCILWAVIFKREALVGCLDEARVIIRPGQDIMMQLICLAKQPKVVFIADCVYLYRPGVTSYAIPRLEAQIAFDEMLQKAFASRWEQLKDYYTLRQLKAYEMLLTFKQFDVKRKYYHKIKDNISGKLPLADRIAYALPPRIAYLLIRLRKML